MSDMKQQILDALKSVPKIRDTAEEMDPVCRVKLFYPDFNWTWYVIESDGQDECFGLVEGWEVELGSFSLEELFNTKGKLGCPIEMDLYFKPDRLSEIKKRCRSQA